MPRRRSHLAPVPSPEDALEPSAGLGSAPRESDEITQDAHPFTAPPEPAGDAHLAQPIDDPGDATRPPSAAAAGQTARPEPSKPRLSRSVLPPSQVLMARSMEAGAGAGAFVARETKGVIATFLDVRGTHLAALIAFYGLLAFFPLVLITLAVTGLVGEQNESSFLIEQLNRAFPGASGQRLASTVNEFREQAVYLAAIGGVAVLWSSIGLFSALESAFNLVYGFKNRPFARGKTLMFLILVGCVAAVFVALVIGSLGVELLVGLGNTGTSFAYAFAIALSALIVFGILLVAYRVLPNTDVTWKQALPGAVAVTAALVGSFQAVPLFVRTTDNLVALRAFGGATLLLVWLFLMANIIVLGAVVNWRLSRGARQRAALEANS